MIYRILTILLTTIFLPSCISGSYKVYGRDSPRKKLIREIFVGCEAKEAELKPKVLLLTKSMMLKLEPIDDQMGNSSAESYDKAWVSIQKLMNDCLDCSRRDLSALYERAAFIKWHQGVEDESLLYFQLALNVHPEYDRVTIERLTLNVAELSFGLKNYELSLRYYQNWEALCPSSVPDSYFSNRSKLHKIRNEEGLAKKYEDWAFQFESF